MEELIVYTSIIGDYDRLLEQEKWDATIRYVCITDQMPTKRNGWDIRLVERSTATARVQQRSYKILSHRMFPEADVTLYIDGNFQLLTNPRELAAYYLKHADLALFRHPERNSVFAELEACADLGKDDPRNLSRVATRYRTRGLPEIGFLYSGGFILRRHTAPIVVFNEAWYEELLQSTPRDQPSLGYTLWRFGLMPATIDENIWRSSLLSYSAHKAKTSTSNSDGFA
jgi:Protein of unknown function (DUF616)